MVADIKTHKNSTCDCGWSGDSFEAVIEWNEFYPHKFLCPKCNKVLMRKQKPTSCFPNQENEEK